LLLLEDLEPGYLYHRHFVENGQVFRCFQQDQVPPLRLEDLQTMPGPGVVNISGMLGIGAGGGWKWDSL
jgi:hypothetical protein